MPTGCPDRFFRLEPSSDISSIFSSIYFHTLSSRQAKRSTREDGPYSGAARRRRASAGHTSFNHPSAQVDITIGIHSTYVVAYPDRLQSSFLLASRSLHWTVLVVSLSLSVSPPADSLSFQSCVSVCRYYANTYFYHPAIGAGRNG